MAQAQVVAVAAAAAAVAAQVAVVEAVVVAAAVASLAGAVGIGWRAELAWAIENRPQLSFIELLIENLSSDSKVPTAVTRLQARGATIALHSVSLSLGGAQLPDEDRLKRLAEAALKTNAKFISDHLAFVRSENIESGHLLPIQRTNESVKIIAENIQIAKAALPAPLAVENIASLFRYPDEALSEAEFLRNILEAADCLLLLDISNLHANATNFGFDALAVLQELPLERLAYVHIAGGVMRGDFYHDTHAHPIPDPALRLLNELCRLTTPTAVVLERDDFFPSEDELDYELSLIQNAIGQEKLLHV